MQEKRHDRVVEMRLCFFSGKVSDYKMMFLATRKCRSTPYGCVRSAEGLSAQRESRLLPSLTDIGGFAATRGCTPCAAYAAIPAHPQKQYTRLWRLYHFCGFSFYPGGDTHSHLSL